MKKSGALPPPYDLVVEYGLASTRPQLHSNLTQMVQSTYNVAAALQAARPKPTPPKRSCPNCGAPPEPVRCSYCLTPRGHDV